ncbi:hypothetical protein [Streptomyces lavendofoliae]|uniref:Uncharacterized protein n=1 Tax=Streptomyces lavendofoliae TaxID=67314 RepID=A0A918I380_9ACTN|nr:hypothetical protein [Streptomyces lavendofoliae]GGU62804.1 hypothetical protein GCM10010274_59550 [Streptomyces lavendofoliae]
MSGGSYNYLHELNHGLEGQRSDIEAMRDRLLTLAQAHHPGAEKTAATQAAHATQSILDLLDQARAQADTLRGVWHAVEYRDSGDYGDDQVTQALTTYREQHATPKAAKPQGVDIEILDRSPDAAGVILPGAVRINGQEALVPSDSTIRINEIREDDFPTITLTLFLSSLTIRHDPT